MEKLPVEKFFGVGKVTAQKMKKMGLHTGADLKNLDEEDLIKHFGKAGRFYYQTVRGMDNREVQPHRETKSLAAEDTFPYDLTTTEEMELELDKIATTVCNRLVNYQLKGRTITLKIKYSDFKQITRNQSFAVGLNDLETISQTAKKLLAATSPDDKKVRLLGISLSNFGEVTPRTVREKPSDQLTLFPFF
jgi:DNA polymerase IV